MSSHPIPHGDQWKDPAFVQAWKDDRKATIEARWQQRLITEAFKPPPHRAALDSIQGEYENILDRADRLEPGTKKKGGRSAEQARHQVPAMIAHDGSWIIHPIAQRATADKLTKTKRMYLEHGLEKKAQREIACGLLGGVVECETGHKFYVDYECGNRYCVRCGPKDATRLFAKQHDRLLFVSQSLMLCGQEDCSECNTALTEKRLPHWPPPKGSRPRIVCAKIDFTLRHERGDQLPAPERMRELNGMIKKFCRALERRFGISRKQYGLAYCDELGGNNSNPHAHGIYVGPWLPQKRKELSALWHEITGDSFILSIKYAEDFTKALFHAVKYPAKFAERSSPERLADLEKVFHRVRRFHTLARFYAPEAPEAEKPPLKKCPLCDSRLTDPKGWASIADLQHRGLQDLEAVGQQVQRDRGLGDRSPP
jgi:hypothetical protein